MARIMAVMMWAVSIAVILSCCTVEVEGYKNYTVGDALGWYDKLMKPTVNYAKWAEGKNFSLGDFLIFNTDTNHSVVQTYNATTYKMCDYDDADDDDTIELSAGDPSTDAKPVTVAAPLVREGVTYFFSGDYDGWHCNMGGQKFQITVAHGQGLPPSLLTPPPGAPAPESADGPDAAPVTNIPASMTTPVPDSSTAADTNINNDDASAAEKGKNPGVFLVLGFVLSPLLLKSVDVLW
uniref:TSA: Wollemia nobilis Ref_Wollemi_Transcript_25066_1100 transcribed RNA sequence n=1 Tax=Wollemia nobilis TaxID=56998 RepID=A0A0C9RQI8_9CONI